MALSVLAVVAVLALLIVTMAVLPSLSSTDKKGIAQTAADAAALGGAEAIRDDVLDALDDFEPWRLDVTEGSRERTAFWSIASPPMWGIGEASFYAGRNDSQIEPGGYSYDAAGATVYTRVRSNDPSLAGNRSRADARAELGMSVVCQVRGTQGGRLVEVPVPTPTPTPTPTPDPSASATPSPTPTPTPPEPEWEWTWGSWSYTFTCTGEGGFTETSTDLDELIEEAQDRLSRGLEPRLVD